MNCKKAERRIYLYRELTPRQREETDRHMASCASCRQLSARINQEREMMREILSRPQPLPDPVRFTQSVMREIAKSQQKKVSAFHFLYAFIFSNPVRYGMAALSMLLVVAFMAEHNTRPVSQNSFGNQAGVKIEMNSASFYEALKEEKQNPETNSSVYQCVMTCLQTKDANCSECRMKFANLIRNHETI